MSDTADTFDSLVTIAKIAGETLPEGSDERAAAQIAAAAFGAAAALTRAGSADPAGHIERILSDDALIAKAHDDWETAIAEKVGRS